MDWLWVYNVLIFRLSLYLDLTRKMAWNVLLSLKITESRNLSSCIRCNIWIQNSLRTTLSEFVRCWTMDSLYACKCICILFQSSKALFWNTVVPHYQWKSHWTLTIPDKTQCNLLHYDSSKHCTCPLNKFISAFIVVMLISKHPVH
jgi:hypothetical protein